jgi:hypothetical protein
LSFIHVAEEFGAEIRAARPEAFETIQGKLGSHFACRVSAHPVGNDQEGAVIIQDVDHVPVFVIFSEKALVGKRLDLHPL